MKSKLAIFALSAVLMSGLILLPGINMKSFAISNEQGQLTLANMNLVMGGLSNRSLLKRHLQVKHQ